MTDAKTRAKAREQHEDEGTLKFDDMPAISRADGNPENGAYVAAWVWVPDDEGEDTSDDT